MKNHKKLIIIVVATVLCTALLGSYLNSVDNGLSTSVTRNGKTYHKGFFNRNHFVPKSVNKDSFTKDRSRKNEKHPKTIKKLHLDEDANQKVTPKLEEIDEIIKDIEDIVGIGTPDGNLVGIGTPDGNLVGIGTPDGN